MCAMASRMGDFTVHGGPITLGCFTVLIELFPAARVGDLLACPIVAPIPHASGLIIWPGALNVLIAGQPAARRADLALCLPSFPNVLIGACSTVDIGPSALTPPFPPFITIPDGTFSGPASWGIANYLGLVNYLIGINALAIVNIGGIAVVALGAVLVAALCVLVVP